MATLVINKKIRYNYSIIEEFEAGLALSGAEVKSCKLNHVKLDGSYVAYDNGELWFNQPDYDPNRPRKLLMHQSEIDSLMGKSKQQGLTLLVESLYTTRSLIKAKVVLARGKKKSDKRDTIKKRDADRKIGRAMRRKI